MNPAANDRLLKRTDVEKLVGLGCSSIYALMSEQNPDTRFPAPIKIGQRSRWSERSVQNWISRQMARAEAA
jgi:predicted DNA-binding transcriptional regulator AlpA